MEGLELVTVEDGAVVAADVSGVFGVPGQAQRSGAGEVDHGGVAEDGRGGFERGVALAEDEYALAGVCGGVGVHVLVAGGVFDAGDGGDVRRAPAGGDDDAAAVQGAAGGVYEEAVVESFDLFDGGVEAYGELVVALEFGEVAHHVVGVREVFAAVLGEGQVGGFV